MGQPTSAIDRSPMATSRFPGRSLTMDASGMDIHAGPADVIVGSQRRASDLSVLTIYDRLPRSLAKVVIA
jgi:hypothetical protein